MEKCLTQTERQEKKTAIRYLRGELKERLDYLNGEPDNLCKAYQTIIESMQRQIGVKDVVKETHSVLRAEQISFKAMLRIFNFFSELTPDERSVVIEASENGEFDRQLFSSASFFFVLRALHYRYSILGIPSLAGKIDKKRKKKRKTTACQPPSSSFLQYISDSRILDENFFFRISYPSILLIANDCRMNYCYHSYYNPKPHTAYILLYFFKRSFSSSFCFCQFGKRNLLFVL